MRNREQGVHTGISSILRAARVAGLLEQLKRDTRREVSQNVTG